MNLMREIESTRARFGHNARQLWLMLCTLPMGSRSLRYRRRCFRALVAWLALAGALVALLAPWPLAVAFVAGKLITACLVVAFWPSPMAEVTFNPATQAMPVDHGRAA